MLKKCGVVVLLACVVGVLAYIGITTERGKPAAQADEFLRIHIRAHSNAPEAQNVKLLVRDEVVCYLTPRLANAQTVEDAKAIVASEQTNLTALANRVLTAHQFPYRASVKLTREAFPARTYDGITLAAGTYDALVVNLGSGEGDNWWCVAFPPLCFVGEEGSGEVVYRSKILEMIAKYKTKNKK